MTQERPQHQENPRDNGDLIDRLMALQDHYHVSGQLGALNSHIFLEAANEINRLREALSWIENEEPQLVDAAREKFRLSAP